MIGSASKAWMAAVPALLALVCVARDAPAEDAPPAGSWRKLAVRRFTIPVETEIDHSLRDLPRILKAYQPAGAKVSDVSVVLDGPRKVPRVTFKAVVHVDVDVGIFTIARDEAVWVRADVTGRVGRCPQDASRAGYEIRMDLTSSDEPLSANASTLVASFCVGDPKNASREVELTSFMQIGPDYGTRVAGRLATNMLIKQTDPFVAALRATLNR